VQLRREHFGKAYRRLFRTNAVKLEDGIAEDPLPISPALLFYQKDQRVISVTARYAEAFCSPIGDAGRRDDATHAVLSLTQLAAVDDAHNVAVLGKHGDADGLSEASSPDRSTRGA
jgi:hypothetical protein